jgi:hypothetical protein
VTAPFVYRSGWTEFKVEYCFADADLSTHKACLLGVALAGVEDEWKVIRFALGGNRQEAGMQLLTDVALALSEVDGVRADTQGQSIR